MTLRTPHDQWQECCEATQGIRVRFGVDAAVDYLVGEKLMAFAQSGEGHPEMVAELPAFAQRVCQLFTSAEIRAHFARADHAALIEPDILKEASAEEVADFEDLIEASPGNLRRQFAAQRIVAGSALPRTGHHHRWVRCSPPLPTYAADKVDRD
jgi:hypothetical protein